MDARREAFEWLQGRFEPRVLEPSPPTNSEPPWFADDPVNAPTPGIGRPVVSPVPNGDLSWTELAADDPETSAWCAYRWVGAYRRLHDLPDHFSTTRRCLTAIAQYVISPARYKANGKIGLRFTRGGFGTPYFGDNVQIRVEGDTIAIDEDGAEHTLQMSTIGELKDALDVDIDPPTDLYSIDQPPEVLQVDAEAAAALGDLFGFTASVLEQLRFEFPDLAPSRVQLWPEHFDIALELGDENRNARAGYGMSPGDEEHDLPYLYVVPWKECSDKRWWRETHFNGVRLDYKELLDADDQRALALNFYRSNLLHLHEDN